MIGRRKPKTGPAPVKAWRRDSPENRVEADVVGAPAEAAARRSRSRSPPAEPGGAVVTVEELAEVQGLGSMMVLADEPKFERALANPTPEFAYAFLNTAARIGYFDADAFDKVYRAAAAHVAAGDCEPAACDALRALDALGVRNKRLGQALADAIAKQYTHANITDALKMLSGWDRVKLGTLEQARTLADEHFQKLAEEEAQSGPCQHWIQGRCKYGSDCRFPHTGAKSVLVAPGAYL